MLDVRYLNLMTKEFTGEFSCLSGILFFKIVNVVKEQLFLLTQLEEVD